MGRNVVRNRSYDSKNLADTSLVVEREILGKTGLPLGRGCNPREKGFNQYPPSFLEDLDRYLIIRRHELKI